MSFFAGRFGDGKTVFSLNSVNGGDIGYHYSPNDNSIFHSDMPFVLVDGTYSAGLGDAGNGYYVCRMSDDIVNIKSNDPGRVILTAIEINGTHIGFLNGTQTSVDFCNQFLLDQNFPGGPRVQQVTAMYSGFGGSTSLDTGTYNYDSNIGHENSIACNGSGGLVYSSGGASGLRDIFGVQSAAFSLLGMGVNTTSVSINSGGANYWEPNFSTPIGSGYNGHYWFYVSRSNIRSFNGFPSDATNAVSGSRIIRGRPNTNGGYVARDSASNIVNQSRYGRIIQDWYDFIPTKVVWYVLNLRYVDGSMQVTGTPFTGSEIRLSPNNFIIKGCRLQDMGQKFIHQNAFGNISNRPDMEFVGNNAAYTGMFGDTSGRCEFIGSSRGSLWAPSVDFGGAKSQLSLYKYNGASQWYVDSRNHTIGNEHGVVWGPSNMPLKLFSSNVASAWIGDDINPRRVDAGNTYIGLSTVGLGLPNNNSTVILTMEVAGGNLNSAGLPIYQLSNGSFTGIQNRKYQSYTSGDRFFHQILTLPPGYFVPFHTTKTSRLYNPYGSSPDPTAFDRGSMTFTIKNLGNGNVEIGCMFHMPYSSFVFTPKVRITIQRLT